MVRSYGQKQARDAIKSVIEIERLIDLAFAKKVQIYWTANSIKIRRVPPEELCYDEIMEYKMSTYTDIQGKKAQYFIMDDLCS